MAIPLIDPLPPAPTPADPEPVFDDKAYEMVAALAPFVEQTNTLALTVEAEAIRSESEADRSQAQVNVATTEANRAKTEAERAKDEADRAEQARDDAVVVVTDGQGSLTPAPGKFPVAGTSGTIKQDWIENLQFELDALRVARNKLMYGEGPYPVLDLQFQGAKYLDPRVTFTRATPDWDWDGKRYEANEPVLSDEGLRLWGSRTNLLTRSEFSAGNPVNYGSMDGGHYEVSYGEDAQGTYVDIEYAGGGGNSDSIMRIPVSTDSNPTVFSLRVDVLDGSFRFTSNLPANYGKHVDRVGLWSVPGNDASPIKTTAIFPNEFDEPFMARLRSFQLETGDVVTPYIPTNGSQVTVATSSLEVKGDAFDRAFNPIQGALIFKSRFMGAAGSWGGVFRLGENAGWNEGRNAVNVRSYEGPKKVEVSIGSATKEREVGYATPFNVNDGEPFHLGLSWQGDSVDVFINGGKVAELSSPEIPSIFGTFKLLQGPHFRSTFRPAYWDALTLFRTRPTDAEMEALTHA